MAEDQGQGQGSDQAQGAEDGTQGQDDGFDKDRALATIQAQRKAEKDLKAQLQTSQAELDQLKAAAKADSDAKLSETEKTQKRIEALEKQIDEGRQREETSAEKTRQRLAKATLRAAAAEAGSRKADHVLRLVDPGSLEFDDDGEVTNAAKVIEAVKKEVPELFEDRKAGSGDGGRRGDPVKPDSGNDPKKLAAAVPRSW